MGRLLALSLVLGCTVEHAGLGVNGDARLDVGRDTDLLDSGGDRGVDAQPPDAGSDAGPPDVGLPDSGAPDSGPPDTGPPDSGPLDTGSDARPPEVCNGVDDDGDDIVDEAGCPDDCRPHSSPAGGAYLFCTPMPKLNWPTARDRCRAVGYGLVSIETMEEQGWLTSTIPGSNRWWIGLNDRGPVNENNFKWVATGDPWNLSSYNNFADPEPNNNGPGEEDCVEMRDNGLWNDTACWRTRFFICEYQPR